MQIFGRSDRPSKRDASVKKTTQKQRDTEAGWGDTTREKKEGESGENGHQL